MHTEAVYAVLMFHLLAFPRTASAEQIAVVGGLLCYDLYLWDGQLKSS